MILTKPDVHRGTSVMANAADIADQGIFPFLHVRTPWSDTDTGCDCGRGRAAPVFHASWCEVRIDWSWGDE